MSIPQPQPRMTAFENLGFGIFLHWGLYSILGKGEWAMKHHQLGHAQYRQLMEQFNAEGFDAKAIAKFAKSAGAKYITLTTRHHDGFSLYDTRGLNTYDAPHAAAGRDLIAEFVEGCRAESIIPFFYHTTADWTWDTDHRDQEAFNEYLDYLHASVEILCKHYGPVGGFWFDGNWMRDDIDWNEDRLYSIIRAHQPEAMIINNTSIGRLGETGHPESDVVTYEQGQPKPMDRNGMVKYLAAEMCQTMNLHWGIATEDWFFKSPKEVIMDLIACRKVGANLLMNIGPNADGSIPDYEIATLNATGRWCKKYAEAIYEVQPVEGSFFGNDFLLKSRSHEGRYYYFAMDLMVDENGHETERLGASIGARAMNAVLPEIKTCQELISGQPVSFLQSSKMNSLTIDVPPYPYGSHEISGVLQLDTL